MIKDECKRILEECKLRFDSLLENKSTSSGRVSYAEINRTQEKQEVDQDRYEILSSPNFQSSQHQTSKTSNCNGPNSCPIGWQSMKP